MKNFFRLGRKCSVGRQLSFLTVLLSSGVFLVQCNDSGSVGARGSAHAPEEDVAEQIIDPVPGAQNSANVTTASDDQEEDPVVESPVDAGSGEGVEAEGSMEEAGETQVELTVDDLKLTEGTPGEAKIEFSQSSTKDLTFNWKIQPVKEGEADNDFPEKSGTFKVLKGGLSASVEVLAAIDELDEKDERHLLIIESEDKDINAKALLTVNDGVKAPVVEKVAMKLAGGGNRHTCFVSRKKVYCWGENGQGELGNGTSDRKDVPTLVKGMDKDVTGIGVGQTSACAIKAGALYCWGEGDDGRLGDGTGASQQSPVALKKLATKVTAVASGYEHSCAVQDGAAFCFGRNSNGQLGNNGSDGADSPVAALGLTDGVTDIAVGDDHSCAIKTGALYCWGKNNSGQLGMGNTDDLSIPTKLSTMTNGVTSVVAHRENTCAIKNGALYCWGDNDEGQLGLAMANDNVRRPQIVRDDDVTAVAIGGQHTCAIWDKKVHCWGRNDDGQLGNNSTEQKTTPQEIAGIDTVPLTLGLGDSHSCVSGDTKTYCWGRNDDGQLGIGGSTSSLVPVPVTLP